MSKVFLQKKTNRQETEIIPYPYVYKSNEFTCMKQLYAMNYHLFSQLRCILSSYYSGSQYAQKRYTFVTAEILIFLKNMPNPNYAV